MKIPDLDFASWSAHLRVGPFFRRFFEKHGRCACAQASPRALDDQALDIARLALRPGATLEDVQALMSGYLYLAQERGRSRALNAAAETISAAMIGRDDPVVDMLRALEDEILHLRDNPPVNESRLSGSRA